MFDTLIFAEAPAGNALPAKFLFRNYIFSRGANWKGTVTNSKWSKKKTKATQMEPKGDQQDANRRKSCSKIMPWSVRSFRFFPSSLLFKRVKTVMAHLSVLRKWRVQVWINSFYFLKRLEKVVSGTCRSYQRKRYKRAEKGCEQGPNREGTVADLLEPFLIKND